MNEDEATQADVMSEADQAAEQALETPTTDAAEDQADETATGSEEAAE